MSKHTTYMIDRRWRPNGEKHVWTDRTGWICFPLSFSLKECLEDLCDRQGYKYKYHSPDSTIGGEIIMSRPLKVERGPSIRDYEKVYDDGSWKVINYGSADFADSWFRRTV